MFATLGYYICVPFAWLLRTFYNLTGSYGWALILFTLIVKLVLLPFQLKSKKSMLRMNKFQPKMKEIQEKYANNQQKMNEELQLLYAQEGINPMSGCLWSLLPFPIIIALYSIIRQPLSRFMLISADVIEKIRQTAVPFGYSLDVSGRAAAFDEINLLKIISENFDAFRSFEPDGLFPVSYNFIGLDLTEIPWARIGEFLTGGWAVIGLVLIPIVSAALSYVQSKLATAGGGQSSQDAAARSGKTMMLMMPLMSLWIGFTLPAALGVYWIANSVFQIIQDAILNKFFSTRMEREETEKERAKREARVAKMMEARERQRAYQEQINSGRGGKSVKKQPSEEKKSEKKGASTNEAGRVGDRPYARGRSYSPDHYGE